jgi:hypothetical protein
VGGESDVSLPLVGPEPLATGGRADNDRHLDETVNRERSPNDFAELDRHNSQTPLTKRIFQCRNCGFTRSHSCIVYRIPSAAPERWHKGRNNVLIRRLFSSPGGARVWAPSNPSPEAIPQQPNRFV